MNNLSLIGGLAGGVGLFLLGMGLMTDGLKLAAGPALERILANATQTRARALASGVLVTAVVQSSSAVTVAAIGFVNAGLLTLGPAIWVLFGANVGTTMTGWLVALVGLKFKIEALALPMIGLGMVLRLSGEGQRRGAMGMAIAGFGVLFLGIDLLKNSFTGVAAGMTLPDDGGALNVLLLVGSGVLLTVLMQSSSAALTVALTAAQGGLLSAQGAAAVVIGANLGTTVTALIAAIGATPNAKRAAAAHILFNLLTGVVALALLPWLINFLAVLREWLDLPPDPAAKLALFHTVFNLLGVLLIWPVAARMTRFLEGRFKAADEDQGRPRYLDKTVLTIPALALDALQREVARLGQMAVASVQAVLREPLAAGTSLHPVAADRLGKAIADFIVQLHRSGMSPLSAARLSNMLHLARDHETAVALAGEAAQALAELNLPASVVPQVQQAALDSSDWATLRQHADHILTLATVEAGTDRRTLEQASISLKIAYQNLKDRLLRDGTQGQLDVTAMDAQLRAASALRRAIEHIVKAHALQSRMNNPEPESEPTQT
jgi:phosphate:Na+ symporter